MTGCSFLPMGEETRVTVLPERLTTLAELLRQRGYRTVGVSANPNHSRANRFDQGYDLFVETWEGMERMRQAIHPREVTRAAVEAIASHPAERPLFLFLHYLPPHEPYVPPPRFHVFGDPAYDAPVDGRRSVTQRFRKGELALDARDRAELVARYDGNLRWVDSSLAQVLAAQRRAGRWERTLVLVASDHGEALFEHGRQGHNANVYEEMIRVPFLLRLPGGARRTCARPAPRRSPT